MYHWQKKYAKLFLEQSGVDLTLVVLGRQKKSKEGKFILRIDDNRAYAEQVAKLIYAHDGTIGPCWHSKKSSWIVFMIPGQAKAWLRHEYSRVPDYQPPFGRR